MAKRVTREKTETQIDQDKSAIEQEVMASAPNTAAEARQSPQPAPACPDCHNRMRRTKGSGDVTHWECPGCGKVLKKPRPDEPEPSLNVPQCPYHQVECKVDRRAGNAYFVYHRCPVVGCTFLSKQQRPSMPSRLRAADADYSAR